ncbi:MAG: hypothetical protein H7326_00355 [Bdellovibrionaceae bacterium]|nr:hypothetical protein [Pseudobdellovibrionaceae bacterium]
MKSLLVSAAALLVSVSAFAMPKIGDQALYALDYTVQGTANTGTYENEITGFDASTGMFTVHTIVKLGTQSQAQDEQSNSLLDDATVGQLIANCAAQGGTTEAVTVPAGTFNACALPISGDDFTGKAWVAAGVSFGMVKMVQNKTDGSVVTLDLQSFRLGQ